MTNESKEMIAGNGKEELLTLDGAADYLAVSKPTLYRMLDRGEVKGIKVGRQWRFRQSDLGAYLTRGPVAMALSTVPLELLDEELGFYAEEFRKIGLPISEKSDDELDIHEQKTISLITRMARLALAAGGSDIHLEAFREGKERYGQVRFRIDGMLHEIRRMPFQLYEALIMHCRVMAKSEPIDKTFVDARIDLSDDIGVMEMRISIMPGVLGEMMTARLRDDSGDDLRGLEKIGLYEEDITRIRKWLRQPDGFIISAGPSGCGKTTLTYAMLREVASPKIKTVTIEDPIECQFPWMTQVELHPGVSFPSALRAFFRHDVDVIMVGEQRDLETIDLTLHSAATGHLVFTVVSVENALRVLGRIVEVFPLTVQDQVTQLITNDANRVIGTRLVRTLCPHCKEPAEIPSALMAHAWQLAKTGGYVIPENAIFYKAVGCDKCRGIGYRGRTGIFELLEISPKIREAFMRKASYEEQLAIAVQEGMHTIAADGIRKAVDGITTIEEVLQVAAI